MDNSGEENGEEDDCKNTDRWRNSHPPASAVIPVSTAIFYVNHQIRQEATEVFYGFNRFTFDADARTALRFLKSLPSSSRRRVNDVGFARRSTCADDSDCMEFWDPVSTFVARYMSLQSVTIQVPHDCNCETDSTKEVRQAPNG